MIIHGLFTRICLFDVYLCQEGGGGEGGEMEHIYNRPKGGLVPPPKEGLCGVGGVGGTILFFLVFRGAELAPEVGTVQ